MGKNQGKMKIRRLTNTTVIQREILKLDRSLSRLIIKKTYKDLVNEQFSG